MGGGSPLRIQASDRRFALLPAAAALVAVLLLLFAALTAAGWRPVERPSILTRDLAAYLAPKYRYAAERVRSGELPLWNPLEFGGIPFLATVQPGVLYPPVRLAYLLFPERGRRAVDPAYRVLFFAHVLAGAFFTLLLLRDLGCRLGPSLFGASWVAFPLWLTRSYEYAVFSNAVVWVPLILLLTRRLVLSPDLRTSALLAAAAAAQVVSGYAPFVLVSGYAAVLGSLFWILERPRGSRLAPAGVSGAAMLFAAGLAGLVASLQLLPTLELASLADRGALHARVMQSLEGWTGEPQVVAFLHMVGLPPLSFERALFELWSEFGPFLVVLAAAAPLLRPRASEVWHLVVLFVLSTLTPLGLILRLPLYGFSRYAVEWSLIAFFAVYSLAALGLDAVVRRLRLRAPASVVLTLCLLGAASAWSASGLARHWGPARAPRTLLELPEVAQRSCGLGPGGSRLFWPRGQVLGALIPMGVPTIGGYEQALLPQRSDRLGAALGVGNGGIPGDWPEHFASHRQVLSRLGLECVVSEKQWPQLVRGGFERLSAPGERPVVYRNPDVLPRARFATSWRSVGSPEEALEKLLRDSGAAPPSDVLLEGTLDTAPPCRDSAASVSIREDHPERVVIEVDARCRGYLVLADNMFPGWQARVDGKDAEIRAADYTGRAVALGPGRHQVVFRYAPRSATLGRRLSLLGLVAVAGCLLIRPARDPLRRLHEAAAARDAYDTDP